jgi:hypothetical protein
MPTWDAALFKDLPSDPPHATSRSTHYLLANAYRLFGCIRDLHPRAYVLPLAIERSQPILDAFSAWLREQTPRVLPKSALGKAIKYCRNQWDRLVAFLEDGRLEIDNNQAERSIKPFVIGRKNWLFSNSAKGAESSAIIYSVVETAKENGLNPFNYFNYLFEELPQYGYDRYKQPSTINAMVEDNSRGMSRSK